MFEPKNIDSCFETVIVAMSAYISQLKDEIDYQQRENERLREELDGYRYRGQTADASVSKDGNVMRPEWLNAMGASLADMVGAAELDSDRDPFEEDSKDV